MSINVEDYYYYYSSVYVPSIDADFGVISIAELEALFAQYDIDVEQYKNEIREIVLKKDYVLERFKKDVLADVGFATIDLENNTYTENYYARKYLDYAIGNLRMNNIDNFNTVVDNITGLYQLFLDKNDQPFSDEMKPAETYDVRAITVFDDIYILLPNTIGIERVYKHGTDTIQYENETWTLVDSSGELIATCENIDAETPVWVLVGDESSESSESSSGEVEPEIPAEESSESSETTEPEEPVVEESSESSEEPVAEESSESSEETVVEESSESSETTEPEEP